jgi:hypothetical protein
VEEKEKIKIPKAPPQLNSKARVYYKQLYQILISEDRGADKYKYQVAIAANALLLYQLANEQLKIGEAMTAQDIGVVIRGLNSASSEWQRSAKALLLTPESELRMEEPPEVVEPPPTMSDVMNELMKEKSRNDNYAKQVPRDGLKGLEAGAKKKLKKNAKK